MSSEGSVIVRVYTSEAIIPLSDATVIITKQNADQDASLLAVKFTNSSGLTDPVYVQTPDPAQSQVPGSTLLPYAEINIEVSYPGFDRVLAKGVQIFPGVETIQGVQLHPLTQNASMQSETVYEPFRQNL